MSKSSADRGDPAPENPPDPKLSRSQISDREAWHVVFEQSKPGLRKFLAGKLRQSADIDDCLQSVSVAMIQNQTNIPQAARRAWLYRVAANEAAKYWRKKAATDRVLEKHAETTYEIGIPDPADLETKETIGRAYKALENLSQDSRQIVRMRINDGMTFAKIADQLQLPLGTVLTRMRRAMQRLRDELDDKND